MSQLVRLGVSLCLVLGLSATAYAHCGSCGAGADKKLEKSCAQKCSDQKDKVACVKKCETSHKKQHKKAPKKG